jgi:hypothetical protein
MRNRHFGFFGLALMLLVGVLVLSSPVASASSPGWDWDSSACVQAPAGVRHYEVVNIADVASVTMTVTTNQNTNGYQWPTYGNASTAWNSASNTYINGAGDWIQYAFVDGQWRFRAMLKGHYTEGAELVD